MYVKEEDAGEIKIKDRAAPKTGASPCERHVLPVMQDVDEVVLQTHNGIIYLVPLFTLQPHVRFIGIHLSGGRF